MALLSKRRELFQPRGEPRGERPSRPAGCQPVGATDNKRHRRVRHYSNTLLTADCIDTQRTPMDSSADTPIKMVEVCQMSEKEVRDLMNQLPDTKDEVDEGFLEIWTAPHPDEIKQSNRAVAETAAEPCSTTEETAAEPGSTTEETAAEPCSTTEEAATSTDTSESGTASATAVGATWDFASQADMYRAAARSKLAPFCISAGTSIPAMVSRVIDGDTFDVCVALVGGNPASRFCNVRLRIFGIDTPEARASADEEVTKTNAKLQRTASRLLTTYAESWVKHQMLWMEVKPVSKSQPYRTTDAFGRTVGDIWWPNQYTYSQLMLEQGFARPYSKRVPAGVGWSSNDLRKMIRKLKKILKEPPTEMPAAAPAGDGVEETDPPTTQWHPPMVCRDPTSSASDATEETDATET